MNPNDILTMTCEHKCCTHFFKETFEKKIQRYDFEAINCFNCTKELDYHILQANISKEFFKIYDNYLVKKEADQIYRADLKDFKDITCPSCQVVNSVDSKSEEFFRCKGCYSYFCSNENCLGASTAHYRKTCQQYKDWLENTIFCPICKREASTYDERFKYCYWHSMIYICTTCRQTVASKSNHICNKR